MIFSGNELLRPTFASFRNAKRKSLLPHSFHNLYSHLYSFISSDTAKAKLRRLSYSVRKSMHLWTSSIFFEKVFRNFPNSHYHGIFADLNIFPGKKINKVCQKLRIHFHIVYFPSSLIMKLKIDLIRLYHVIISYHYFKYSIHFKTLRRNHKSNDLFGTIPYLYSQI